MTNFNEYLLEADKEKQIKIIDKIVIEDDIKEKIMSNTKDIDLLVFAESYCPDCIATVGILENFAALNSKINIKYVPREGNRELLESINSEVRIPTIAIKENNEYKLIFSEMPDAIKQKMNVLNKMTLQYSWRIGKHNTEAIQELYNKIFE